MTWPLCRERRLHRLPGLDRLVARVELDVAPAHDLAMGDVVLQLEAVGEADRQGAGLQARDRRHQLAPHRVAAFAVQQLAGAQIALGD